MWGLRLMIELVDAGQLTEDGAIEVAQTIHEINPRYVTVEIIQRFRTEIENCR